MAHIKINYDGLQHQSASMRNCIQNYESLLSRTNSLIHAIQGEWEGQSSTAYTETVMYYVQQAKQMIAVLERFRNICERVIQRFYEVDSNCARMINQSF